MLIIIFLPVVAVAVALIVIGVPYCFINAIKDLRAGWSIAGAYAGCLASLFVVIDLHHFEQVWTKFSLPKMLLVISFVGIGALTGWAIGTQTSHRKVRK